MTGLAALLGVLDLEPTGEGRYRAQSIDEGRDVVFGGQLLGQSIVAASRAHPEKLLRSLHIVFARSASTSAPIEIEVEPIHAGRSLASATVTVSQGGRPCARSLAVLDAGDADLIRHAEPMPVAGPPEHDAAQGVGAVGWELRVVDGVDIGDPDALGPAELNVWSRFPGAPDDPVLSRALLAYASDGFLIGTAMRPHPGVGQRLAHVSISTTVISHTVVFHDSFDAGDWLLLAHVSPHAGGGRSYGTANVYTGDGRMVASYSQGNMIRDFPEGRAPAPGGSARH